MKRFFRFILTLTLLVLAAGCATGPKFAEVSDRISQRAPDTGRIYLYRTTTLGAALKPQIKLNGKPVGKSMAKGFLYVDVEPGNYEIMTSTEVDRKLSLTLERGQTRYIKFGVSMGFFVGHVYPELVEGEVGMKEIQECSYTGDTI